MSELQAPELATDWKARAFELAAECRRHAGNVVEVYALVTKCSRHNPHIRGCAWHNNTPCKCCADVGVYFPEYRQESK